MTWLGVTEKRRRRGPVIFLPPSPRIYGRNISESRHLRYTICPRFSKAVEPDRPSFNQKQPGPASAWKRTRLRLLMYFLAQEKRSARRGRLERIWHLLPKGVFWHVHCMYALQEMWQSPITSAPQFEFMVLRVKMIPPVLLAFERCSWS